MGKYPHGTFPIINLVRIFIEKSEKTLQLQMDFSQSSDGLFLYSKFFLSVQVFCSIFSKFSKIVCMTIPYEPIWFDCQINVHLVLEYLAFFLGFRYYLYLRKTYRSIGATNL